VSTPAIRTEALSKRYPRVGAVDGVSLQVRPGEIYALLGLNGAGKTTMIRMLLGMVRPTAGAVSMLGTPVDPAATDLWARVGHLVETPAAYPELSVRENLDAVRRLHRLPDGRSVDDILDRLALTPYADRRARTLSLGNLQRLGLAKALIHAPDLLVLDEPANALDPAGVVEIRNMLVELAADHGTTVFLSSHLLAEVSRIATRIGVIHEGRLVTEFTGSELPARVRRWLVVSTRDNTCAEQILRAEGFLTEPHPGEGLLPEASHDPQLVLREPSAVQLPDRVAELLVGAGCPPTRLVVEQEGLEEYFLGLVGRSSADVHGAEPPTGEQSRRDRRAGRPESEREGGTW
jgi:ABC-2 type transport system ATP-binding protein